MAKKTCRKAKNSKKSRSKTKRGGGNSRSRSQKSLSGAGGSVSKMNVSAKGLGKGASIAGLSMGPGAAGGQNPQGGGVFGEQSQQAVCPQCNTTVQTLTTSTPGLCTYILCCVTIPCCFVPFLMDCSKDIEHRCPTCGFFFGKYQRLNI